MRRAAGDEGSARTSETERRVSVMGNTHSHQFGPGLGQQAVKSSIGIIKDMKLIVLKLMARHCYASLYYRDVLAAEADMQIRIGLF